MRTGRVGIRMELSQPIKSEKEQARNPWSKDRLGQNIGLTGKPLGNVQ